MVLALFPNAQRMLHAIERPDAYDGFWFGKTAEAISRAANQPSEFNTWRAASALAAACCNDVDTEDWEM
jgi:hypothetical protein